jgi:uncharacterized repeat protein (TIGR03833 family)
MNGQYRKDIQPGVRVEIILKKDQRSGRRTAGVVKDILTSSAYHSRGIKVRLVDGQIGRVQAVLTGEPPLRRNLESPAIFQEVINGQEGAE